MGLEYALEENLLTSKADDLSARVLPGEADDIDALSQEMLDLGAGLTLSDIQSVLRALEKVVTRKVAAGRRINTPLFNVSYSITGTVVPGAEDEGKGLVAHVNLHPGLLMRDAARQITMSRKPSLETAVLETVTDVATKSVNGTITPGNAIKAVGSKIRIEGTDPRCGFRLRHKTVGSTIVISADKLITNNPAELIALLPLGMANGEWELSVTTQYMNGGKHLLKEPRTVTFAKKLRVEGPTTPKTPEPQA